MDLAEEHDAARATIDRIERASGKRPVGWLGAGLTETWNTLDYLPFPVHEVRDTRRPTLKGDGPTVVQQQAA